MHPQSINTCKLPVVSFLRFLMSDLWFQHRFDSDLWWLRGTSLRSASLDCNAYLWYVCVWMSCANSFKECVGSSTATSASVSAGLAFHKIVKIKTLVQQRRTEIITLMNNKSNWRQESDTHSTHTAHSLTWRANLFLPKSNVSGNLISFFFSSNAK